MRRWTPAEIDQLVALRDTGTIAEIAERLGRTYGAVASKRHWLKQQQRPCVASENRYKRWTEAEDAQLLELLKAQRYTYAEISSTLGRTAQSLSCRMKFLKTPWRPIPENYNFLFGLPPEEWRPLLRSCHTCREVADRLGKSGKLVSNALLRRYGTSQMDAIWEQEGWL